MLVSIQLLKGDEARADDFCVPNSGRIAWGHAVVGVGVLVRRLSGPAALLTLAALVLAGATSSGAGVATVVALGLPVLVLVGGRSLAVLLGAIGWIVFPPEHRTVLSDIASELEPGV
ncbi:MAG: hypothetical protein AVDCRST_MAG17-76 [uncultured Solirubrobacterales bacterium]|uniref:Uncharacterized protein n=1 Tax=uncultured Solirubrobacterales bacterium TaxID=768556 RepID=A0A6J4RZG8_9ACTN|nr:MAG: hypothetical protein AVDCRST_MAG17-76 [uncultured Solirubrobacterales bacterium]